MTKTPLIILLTLLSLAACVPTSKFNELKTKSDKCDQERELLKNENDKLTVNNTELNSKLDLLNKEVAQLLQDSAKHAEEYKKLETENNNLKQAYSDLQSTQRGSSDETRKLLTQLQKNETDLQAKEDKLHDLDKSLNEKKQNLEDLKQELDKRNVRLSQLERVLFVKDSVVAALKQKVADALLGFEGNGLTIKQINGKVYVSLEEKLLFASGSTIVDPKGISALKKLAKILEQDPDINIMIEGHTDDVPYRSDASIKDNWDLSVKRATSIVRILLDGSKINPKRLTASGRGEYVPVDKGKTAEALQKNRRTEIILTPKLDELFKVLENN